MSSTKKPVSSLTAKFFKDLKASGVAVDEKEISQKSLLIEDILADKKPGDHNSHNSWDRHYTHHDSGDWDKDDPESDDLNQPSSPKI